MLHLVNTDRRYDPETVAIMTAAFDSVCRSLAPRINANDDVKEKLALIILRHIDQGARDSEQLANVALREWTGSDRALLAPKVIAP